MNYIEQNSNPTKMNSMKSIQNKDLGLLLLRITLGGLMLFHGIHKIQQPLEAIHHLSEDLTAAGLPGFFAYSVHVSEFIAPLLLIIGWRSKIWSALIAVTMFFAIYAVFLDQIFKLDEKTGAWAIELQVFYLMTAVVLFFTGAGRYAISTKHGLD